VDRDKRRSAFMPVSDGIRALDRIFCGARFLKIGAKGAMNVWGIFAAGKRNNSAERYYSVL
jgi:hypothetical protein